MPFTTTSVTIASGQSLSDAVNASGGNPLFILMPPEWTPANLSFQLSPDNVTFGDLFDIGSREVIIPCAPGTSVPINNLTQTVKGSYFKIRSGSRDYPVPQAAARTFAVAIET